MFKIQFQLQCHVQNVKREFAGHLQVTPDQTKSNFKDDVLYKFQEKNLDKQNQHLQILAHPSEHSIFFTILQLLYSFIFSPFKELSTLKQFCYSKSKLLMTH